MDNDNPLNIGSLGDVPIGAATALAAVALNMSLKWHDVTVVKDGVLYQQLKIEGKQINPVQLSSVFSVAEQFERYLAKAPGRFSEILLEAAVEGMEEELRNPPHPGTIIQSDILPPIMHNTKLSQDQVAARLELTAEDFNAILAGEKPVTDVVARKLHREFGYKSEDLVGLQEKYDRHHAGDEENVTVGYLLEGKLAEFGIDNESAANSLNVPKEVVEAILKDQEKLDDAMLEVIADIFQLDVNFIKSVYARQTKNA